MTPFSNCRKTGVCRAWKATFGWLDCHGVEYFVHQTAIRAPGVSFRSLVPGAQYTFETAQGPKGLLAVDVRPL